MESGKRAEAGPSSTTLGGRDEEKEGSFREMKEKESVSEGGIVIHDEDEDDDDDGEDDDGGGDGAVPVPGFVPGPLLSLREQIEKDKEDDSLRRWIENLVGSVESDLNDQMEPEVKFHSIGIISDDFGEISNPLPVDEQNSGRVLFTLREGSQYRFKVTFSVLHNIVSGLKYSNKVWKAGIRVDRSTGMLGAFAPQREPYEHTLHEETTPSGALARGIYSARLKFEDDDKRVHMDLKYSFEIKKKS